MPLNIWKYGSYCYNNMNNVLLAAQDNLSFAIIMCIMYVYADSAIVWNAFSEIQQRKMSDWVRCKHKSKFNCIVVY